MATERAGEKHITRSIYPTTSEVTVRNLPRLLIIMTLSSALLFTPGCACINSLLNLLPFGLLLIQNTPDGENTIVETGQKVVFSEGLAAVLIKGRWGYIGTKGEWVLPPRYESAFAFRDGLAQVCINGEICIVDRTGKIVSDVYRPFSPCAVLLDRTE